MAAGEAGAGLGLLAGETGRGAGIDDGRFAVAAAAVDRFEINDRGGIEIAEAVTGK